MNEPQFCQICGRDKRFGYPGWPSHRPVELAPDAFAPHNLRLRPGPLLRRQPEPTLRFRSSALLALE